MSTSPVSVEQLIRDTLVAVMQTNAASLGIDARNVHVWPEVPEQAARPLYPRVMVDLTQERSFAHFSNVEARVVYEVPFVFEDQTTRERTGDEAVLLLRANVRRLLDTGGMLRMPGLYVMPRSWVWEQEQRERIGAGVSRLAQLLVVTTTQQLDYVYRANFYTAG